MRTVLDRLADGGGEAGAWYVPPGGTVPADLLPGLARHDLEARFGVASGALGVLQCAAAIAGFDRGDRDPVFAVSGGDGAEASAGLMLRPCRG